MQFLIFIFTKKYLNNLNLFKKCKIKFLVYSCHLNFLLNLTNIKHIN